MCPSRSRAPGRTGWDRWPPVSDDEAAGERTAQHPDRGRDQGDRPPEHDHQDHDPGGEPGEGTAPEDPDSAARAALARAREAARAKGMATTRRRPRRRADDVYLPSAPESARD